MAPLLGFGIVLVLLFLGLYLVAQTERLARQGERPSKSAVARTKGSYDTSKKAIPQVGGSRSSIHTVADWQQYKALNKGLKLDKDQIMEPRFSALESSSDAHKIIEAFGGIQEKRSAQASTLKRDETISHRIRSGSASQNRRRKLPRVSK